MNRISALTCDTDSSSSDEDESHVTREAQETIAVSEYLRALQYKAKGQPKNAEFLMRELLDTQVLTEATKDDKDSKLYHVKYSCLKNLGLICAERDDKRGAVEFLLKASKLDDTDVAMMNRMGKLGLELNLGELAQMAFQACLKQNPNHWPAADGMLRVLCLREDYAEAYGWALMWYERDATYKFALDVILEIREKFDGFGLEYIERLWKNKFTDTHLKRTNVDTVFPKYIMPELEPMKKPDLTGFHLDEANLTWLNAGEFIVRMYEHFRETEAIGYDMNWNEWCGRNVDGSTDESSGTETINTADPKQPDSMDGAVVTMDIVSDDGGSKENSTSNTDPIATAVFAVPPTGAAALDAQTSADASATEESDGGAVAASKPKASRRRGGGDLVGLEQWGWHKNKRYAQRKKSLDKSDVDTTVNGMLRKSLAKYFEETFNENLSPFASTLDQTDDAHLQPNKVTASIAPPRASLEQFHLSTQDGLVAFVTELKNRPHFDLMVLMLKYCQYISVYWDQSVPEELHEIYMKVYIYHLNHWDIAAWNQLGVDDFKAEFRMTLFYLELFHDRAMRKANDECKNELDETWLRLFGHLLFHTGFYEHDPAGDPVFDLYRIRFHWLKYLQARYEYNLELAVEYLYATEELMQLAPNQELRLVNVSPGFSLIDLPTLNRLKTQLERSIRLNSIPQLYRDRHYAEIIPILIDSLQSCDWKEDPIASCSSSAIDDGASASLLPTVQFEVLLECFWQVDREGECLIWCEACLAYALHHFLKAPADTARQTKWGGSVTFVLVYLVEIFREHSASVVEMLGRFGSRLVQNIARVVVHQLDSPYDKNHNPAHPIDIKLPWVLLHKLIQREEDVQYARKRRAAYAIDQSTVAIQQQTHASLISTEVPISIMMFFTVHEFLGLRSWCTLKDGQMLLYIMDVVADQLRTPALDRHHDIIAEYLEQVTYCLYGYPAKKARARHIEEHDACNVELTWPRAQQLFDLYCPETLPEFNSYKNDSISADMEQLLQRIVALIPPEFDTSSQSEAILDYITGCSALLPQVPNPLPLRMRCIHYLLADHYFKNRDLSRSVRYYVLDLAVCPTRFDAWAGLALSKASCLETKLNACTAIATNEFLSQCEESLRCFEQCFRLDDGQVPLWIEYGNFAYTMHTFCSRSLKLSSETLSMERFDFIETKKEQCLKIAADCFNTVNALTAKAEAASRLNPTVAGGSDPDAGFAANGTVAAAAAISSASNNAAASASAGSGAATNGCHPADDSHDEQWLYHYMLGKVAEKRKDPPDEVIGHYIESAQCLYEHNASYPFKISHSNPQHLSVEALEVYYRITSCIVKYLEQHSTITRTVGRFFVRVLREVNASPFALNQAKIDDHSINALKRKNTMAQEAAQVKKLPKLDGDDAPPTAVPQPPPTPTGQSPTDKSDEIVQLDTVVLLDDDEDAEKATTEPCPVVAGDNVPDESVAISKAIGCIAAVSAVETLSPSRRGSQESNMTTTTNGTVTTATTTGTSDTTSSSSSDTSSSDSSSDEESDSTDEDAKSADTPLSENELEAIYKTCIKNLEECVTRFPEHYKSIYRLVNIYLHAPDRIRDLKRCKQLLLGTYTTGLGNHIQGLFVDRKLNNFFNGVWRIPSTEIDRPGSFAAHLSKCTIVLMEVLRLSADHKVLLELALQLQRNPENDKRYIKDVERGELFQQAISFCTQSFRQLLKEHGVDRRNDGELILLLLDTYKAYKKYFKYTSLKECPFAVLLSDEYRVYLEGKLGNVRVPENFNATDYAIRFCQHEIGLRKNLAKNGGVLPAPAQPESFMPAHVLRALMNPAPPPVVPAPVPNVVLATTVAPTTAAAATAATAAAAWPSLATDLSVASVIPAATPLAMSVTPSSSSVGGQYSGGPVVAKSLPPVSLAPDRVVNTTVANTNTMAAVPFTTVSSQLTSHRTHIPQPPTVPAPRPRGRPPGSKNSNSNSANSAAAIQNANLMSGLPFAQMDHNTMAAMMGIYSNPSLNPAQYKDPAAVTALLAEYFKLTNFTGMSSLMAGSNPLANSAAASHLYSMPPTTSSAVPMGGASKLPIFEFNSLISSAAEKLNPAVASTSAAAAASAAHASTVISIGSGQLTITPSTVQSTNSRSGPSSSSSSSKSTSNKQRFSMDHQTSPQASGSSQMFSDMPGISVTKVKTSAKASTSTPGGMQIQPIDLPKDLPKSLTITPTPMGLPPPPKFPTMQYPQVTMQPEPPIYPNPKGRPPKQPGGGRKRQPKVTPPLSSFAALPQYAALAGGPSSSAAAGLMAAGRSNPMMPDVSSYTAAPDYAQQLNAITHYAELMKHIDPAASSKLYAQFEQYAKYTKKPSAAKPPKQPKSQSGPAKPRLTVKQLQSLQQQPGPSSSSQLHNQQPLTSMQHPMHPAIASVSSQSQPRKMASPKSTYAKPIAGGSSSAGRQAPPPQTHSPNLSSAHFTMPAELLGAPPRTMTSPFSCPPGSSLGPMGQAHSPLKSPVLPPPPQMSPGHAAGQSNQISPSKTLQQKLAERQRELSNANNKLQQQQQQQGQRPDSVGPACSSSSSSKSDNIIILD